jgi:ParB-like chromosome segregation protein Spo0J
MSDTAPTIEQAPPVLPPVREAPKPPVQPPVKAKTYEVHHFANIFPPMTGKEFSDLLDDIRVNGQTQPATLWREKLIEGKHRQEACKQLGRELKVTVFTGTEEEALKFVISQNLHRRHLNPSQLGLIAAEIANVKLGANQHTKQEGSIDLPIAAKMVGVSEKSVKRCRNVLQKAAPELVQQIREGKLRVGKVNKKVLKLAKDEQVKAFDAKKPELPASTKLADKTTKLANSLIDALKKMDKDARTTTASNIIKLLKAVA